MMSGNAIQHKQTERRHICRHRHHRPQPQPEPEPERLQLYYWRRWRQHQQRLALPVPVLIQILLLLFVYVAVISITTTTTTTIDHDGEGGSFFFVSCVRSSGSSRGSSSRTRREGVEKLVGPYRRAGSTLDLPADRIIRDYLLLHTSSSIATHPNPQVRAIRKELSEITTSSHHSHGGQRFELFRRGPRTKGWCSNNNSISRRCNCWFSGFGSTTANDRVLNICRGGSSSETSSSDHSNDGGSPPVFESGNNEQEDSTLLNESSQGMASMTTTTTPTGGETSTNNDNSTFPAAQSSMMDSPNSIVRSDVNVESSVSTNQITSPTTTTTATATQQPQTQTDTRTDPAIDTSSSSTQVVKVEHTQPSGNENKAIVEKNQETQPYDELQQHPDDDPKVLMLIRVLFFAYYASLGSLLPYLPVYYHSLGHGGQIIGMLGAIKPFTTFLVAPLWGVVSDQTGSPFIVLYFTFIVSLLGQLMVSWRHDHLWIMVMVFLTAFFNAPVKSLLDSMVMSNLKDRSRYGRLRLWGQLGFGVGSSCVGYLLSKSHHDHVPYTPKSEGTSWMQHLDDVWQTITGYKLLFFTYLVLSIPTFVCVRAFDQMTRERQQQNLQKQEQQKQLGKENTNDNDESNSTVAETKPSVLDGITVLFQNSDAIFFFFLVLVVGISSGIIENFAYVRIREVGGTGKEMGLCRLVSSLAGAPMFWFSGSLTELLGADRVIVVGLINYVVRYFNYALIKSPLQALPAEALRGMTFAAFWSTCTIYATRIAPPGMQATMLMFLNAMYGGLGQSLGAIIGGKLQSNVGTVQTFLYAGLFDTLFVGLVIAYLKVRKDSSFKNPQPIVPKVKK